jgi:ATP-dependent protease HslVU (ClpYQ) peptidase subunit
MSTITVVKKGGLAAIAADSLTKWGAIKETADYVANHEKIFEIQSNYLAIAGPTAARLVLRHYFGSRQRVRLGSVDEIFATWIGLHQALKERYYLNPDSFEEDDPAYESTQMDVLIANAHGIFGVGVDRAVQEYTRFSAFGYGCEYALGAMWLAYDDPDRSAEDIARLGVQAAAEFDDSTALPVASRSVRLAR